MLVLSIAVILGCISQTLSIYTTPTTVYRPSSQLALRRARQRAIDLQRADVALHFSSEQTPIEDAPLEWHPVNVLGPDITKQHTIVQLARMAGNAYSLPNEKSWYELDKEWDNSYPVGWESHSEGFRGHVFLNSDNSTAVLSIKGTTLQGPTSKLDKFNDNLLFSCCCGKVDPSWVFHTVCNCFSSIRSWKCDNTCLSNALVQDSLFYSIGVKLVEELLLTRPSANIWLVGHSLGGSLASLLGGTFGLPAVAFEAPGERLAAKRLNLPLPPPLHASSTHPPVAVTHVYNTADPIPQGACTGPLSPCAQGGYALETRCHLGKSIVYDTVRVLRWQVDVRRHIIKEVIHGVLEKTDVDWDMEIGVPEGSSVQRTQREVPLALEEWNCVDCYKWEFGDFKDKA